MSFEKEDDQVIKLAKHYQLGLNRYSEDFHRHFIARGGKGEAFSAQNIDRNEFIYTVNEVNQQFYRGIRWRSLELSARSEIRGRKLLLHTDFIKNNKFNAHIDHINKNHTYISINSGLCIRMQALCMMLWENAFTISEKKRDIVKYFNPYTKVFQNTYRGTYWHSDLKPFLPNFPGGDVSVEMLEEEFAKLIFTWSQQKDNQAQQYQRIKLCIAAIMACDFVFYHELSHVIHGHSLFAYMNYDVFSLNECDDGGGNSLFPEKHMMEFIADRSASLTVGRYLATEAGSPNLIPEFDPVVEEFTSRSTGMDKYERAVYLFSFCLFILIASFDLSGRSPASYRSSSHPHPELRALTVFLSLCDAFRVDRNLDDAMRLREFCLLGYHNAVMALQQAGLGGHFFPAATDREKGYLGDLGSKLEMPVTSITAREWESLSVKSRSFDSEIAELHLPILTGRPAPLR